MSLFRQPWLLAAVGSIVAGYLVLAVARDTVVAPVLLVAGYCVLLPLHLWVRHRADREVGE